MAPDTNILHSKSERDVIKLLETTTTNPWPPPQLYPIIRFDRKFQQDHDPLHDHGLDHDQVVATSTVMVQTTARP